MEETRAIIEQVTTTVSDIAKSDVVAGTPLQVGPVTVVTISRVSAGLGGGGGEGESDPPSREAQPKKRDTGAGAGRGGGSAGGARVRPVAVVVFRETGVDVLPIADPQGKVEKLIDQIPSLIERFNKRSDE